MDRLAEIAEKFGNSLKPHDKEQFESSTLEDMQTDLSDIQSKQDRTKTMMNMNRIKKFMSGMEDLAKALAAINVRDAGRAMAYVWGSIRFLLKVCEISLDRDLLFRLSL
jgi:soluble cytochrome b562